MNRNNLYLIGDLQYYAIPYVSLYVNRIEDKLYIAIRISDYDNPVRNYILAETNSENILAYMNNKIHLSSIVIHSPKILLWQVNINTGLDITKKMNKDEALSHISSDDEFDKEFCDEESTIYYYLRYKPDLEFA